VTSPDGILAAAIVLSMSGRGSRPAVIGGSAVFRM
jgi:hypothetical protein